MTTLNIFINNRIISFKIIISTTYFDQLVEIANEKQHQNYIVAFIFANILVIFSY